MCRGHRTEPCGCAYSAASLHRELLKVKEEVDLNRQLRQEAFLTIDAYRYAFEEQLLSTKQLMKCINDLATRKCKKGSNTFKLSKESEAVLQEVLGRASDQTANPSPQETSAQTSHDLTTAKLKQLDLDSLDSPHLIPLLLEMLQEKSELLAFQKLAARILSNKVKELQFLQCEHLLQPTYNSKCMNKNSKAFTGQTMPIPEQSQSHSPITLRTNIKTPISMSAPASPTWWSY